MPLLLLPLFSLPLVEVRWWLVRWLYLVGRAVDMGQSTTVRVSQRTGSTYQSNSVRIRVSSQAIERQSACE